MKFPCTIYYSATDTEKWKWLNKESWTYKLKILNGLGTLKTNFKKQKIKK